MINSMTGFGSKEAEITPFGKISVELRSSNHKFLETVFHLPEGFLALEDRIKKLIEAKIKRGRIICAINIIGGLGSNVFINKALLKNYTSRLRKIRQQCQIKDDISINTLINLPGVLSLAQNQISKTRVWPRLQILVNQALASLVKTRQREGQALYHYLKSREKWLKSNLGIIKARFKKVIQEKLGKLNTDEERTSYRHHRRDREINFSYPAF